MPPTVSLTPAEQLVVRDARADEAVALWDALRALYLARRGPVSGDTAAPPVPAVQVADAIDLVNAYERLAMPLAPALALGAPALWAAWRQAYARVFAVATHAPNLYAPLPAAADLWRRLLAPFATHLAAFAAHHPIPFTA